MTTSDAYTRFSSTPSSTSSSRRIYRGRSIANSRAPTAVRLERAAQHKAGNITVTDYTLPQLAKLWGVSQHALDKKLRNGNGGNGGNHNHHQPVEAALHKLRSLSWSEQVEFARQFGTEEILEVAAAAEKATAATDIDADVADWWKELNGPAGGA